jgi:hypothetical protein
METRYPRTSSVRHRFRVLPAMLILAGVLVLCGPGRAGATTGASTPTPARYKIALKLAQPFRGQYSLVTGGKHSRLISGAMAVDLNDIDYLFGMSQFRTYDAHGHQTTLLLGLYNFHLVARGQLLATIYDSTDTLTLGHMTVAPKGHADLVGQLTLGRQTYAVHWHKNVSL